MDKCNRCRKFGTKLFLKGAKCLSPKCSFTRRNYQPGAHGGKNPNQRKSEYGLQLVEKQKAKVEYGLREREFTKVYRLASKSKDNTGMELLSLLERRLDNIVYRLGWASSRAEARQFVSHKKILVNKKVANIPSMVLKPKDEISPVKKEAINIQKTTAPKWLSSDSKKLAAIVLHKPVMEEIETDLDSQKILEFYSR